MTGFIPIDELHALLNALADTRTYITSMEEGKEAIKQMFGRNIKLYRVSVMPDFNYLVFESEDVLKNWLYYGGLEYCDPPNQIRYENAFLAWYHYDDHDRIAAILDGLKGEDGE